MKKDIKQLLGKIITNIEVEDDQVTFTTSDDAVYRMLHYQDCCESVTVDDVIGDIKDLLNSPITMAEEVTSDENPEGFEREWQESFTWTFYKLATIKGYVTIRWYGESNGYYSESVDFCQIRDGKEGKQMVYCLEKDGSTCIYLTIGCLLDGLNLELEDQDFESMKNEEYTISVKEMSDKQLRELPDFDGY